MATIAPRSLEQRTVALGNANRIRMREADFKREIRALPDRAATLFIARTLLEDPERIAKSKVHVIVEAVPRFGPVKARQILTRHQIWPLKPMREVTQRQRTLLAGELVRHASRLGAR